MSGQQTASGQNQRAKRGEKSREKSSRPTRRREKALNLSLIHI